jgi:Fur family ferric uptake transcriptional regulator
VSEVRDVTESSDKAPDKAPDWREELRARGYRLTPQRELILGAVEQLGHGTPDEIFACVSETSSAINISTVYRTLEVLEELGLVRHLHLSDRAPTYHSARSGPVHFHLSCRNCGAVISVAEERAAALSTVLESEFGFAADVAHLTIFGAHTPACPKESIDDHHH